MARTNELVYALNAGSVDADALSRIDMEKMRLAGEHPVTNWWPTVLGPMTLRPGLEAVNTLPWGHIVTFLRGGTDSGILAFSNNLVSIYDANGASVNVANPATTITNPTFTSGGGGWSDVSQTGDGTDGTVTLGVSGGLTMLATRWRSAAAEQAVSVGSGDQSTPHTLRISVTLGPVFFRVGTASGKEDIVGEERLLTGEHKLTFTPGVGTIYIRIRSEDPVNRYLGYCMFEHTALGGGGQLLLSTPWAVSDLPSLAWDQSADVMYIGDGIHKPRRIERRGATSWSITEYDTKGGPLEVPDTDKITLAFSALTGNGTLSSNIAYFRPSHVGSLFELTHNEQNVSEELSGLNQYTDYISVNGLWDGGAAPNLNDREFSFAIDMTTGSFIGTIALERSTDPDGEIWAEWESHTSDASGTKNDKQSNIICHYRLRVTAYTSGYANVTLTYKNGSKTGLVRVVGYINDTSVYAERVSQIGGTTATNIWRGPAWSDDLGWPRVPRFRDGRLHWFRRDTDYASKVDDFSNFDDTEEGDAAPFIRSVGSGPADGVLWALDMDKLTVATSVSVSSVQASDLGEVLTASNFGVRKGPSVGAAMVPPVEIDGRAIMTDRTQRRLFDIGSTETGKLTAGDVTRLNPSAVLAGVVGMAVSRRPDTRVYIVLTDGTVAVLTYEREDKVVAFTRLTTSFGSISGVCVVPGFREDRVFFAAQRGPTIRLLRLAYEADQKSVSTCALLDGHKVLTGSVSSISGGSQLGLSTVHVWGDGVYRGTVALDMFGNAALGATYSRVVYGLGYDATFLSVKLAYAAKMGTAIGETKIVHQVSPILSNSVLDGIRIGMDASNTDPMPDIVDGAERTAGQFFSHYDEAPFPIPGEWGPDSRIYIKASSQYGPVTVQSIVLDVETRDGAPNGNG